MIYWLKTYLQHRTLLANPPHQIHWINGAGDCVWNGTLPTTRKKERGRKRESERTGVKILKLFLAVELHKNISFSRLLHFSCCGWMLRLNFIRSSFSSTNILTLVPKKKHNNTFANHKKERGNRMCSIKIAWNSSTSFKRNMAQFWSIAFHLFGR